MIVKEIYYPVPVFPLLIYSVERLIPLLNFSEGIIFSSATKSKNRFSNIQFHTKGVSF